MLVPSDPHFECYSVTTSEIDAICDLARRAPRPKPEPRPSSALLKAAKDVLVELDILRRGQRPQRVPMFVHADTHTELRQAIEAEEARGPSEIEQLRKERDEAIARAEESEASEKEEMLKFARADQRLADAVMALEFAGVAKVTRYNLAEKIGELSKLAEKADRAILTLTRSRPSSAAISTPPQQNHIGSILPLRGWLRRRVEGWISSHEVLEDVVELLVRRELARWAK